MTPAGDEERAQELEELLEYLRRSRGFDFSAYKRSSLGRRVQKRMQASGIESFLGYSDYLEAHPQEFTLLFNTILINVTGFFRDPQTWDFMASDVIPRILAVRNGDGAIRLWSAGCSSGEEAYSLAMLLGDALGPAAFRDRVKIYATDVDEEALAQARQASYSDDDISVVPPAMREKYFEGANGRHVFNPDLRRSIIFGRHDLIQDPPISRVDLLACRNTLMYFNSEIQQRILERFHFGLQDGGFLLLGKAEMLLTRSTAFAPFDLKRRIFTKISRAVFRNGVPTMPPRGNNGSDESQSEARIRDLAMQADPTAQIVVDRHPTLMFANERARAMFALTPTDVGRPLQDLEISYRPVELRSLIDRASAERHPVIAKDIEWTTPAGERIFFDVHILPLIDTNLDPLGAKVVFRDVTRYRRLEDDLKNSHQELETANEELQSTNEELETTNEELQSTVEELETTNEELQSTNEELETMNEELQSTNEELQASNEQLRQNGDELNRENAFLENILESFHDGLLVVDSELHVQAWNSGAEDLWGLRPVEVRGKHLMNLDIGLPIERLRAPIRRCLLGESRFERLSVDATNRRGRGIELEVTCTAFSIGKNATWGVIVTMEDKTSKTAAQSSSE